MNGRIAVFLDQPRCSSESINGVFKALEPKYNFKIFTKQEVERDFFDNVDAVLFPGGIGDSETYHRLLKNNGERVKNFVRNGGKYIGICMGAYWAGSHYFNILEDADAVQYIRRPNTETRRPHAKNIDVIWDGKSEKMFFYDGCAIVGDERKFQTIARYANGDPMAVIQNNIGLVGCHPESLPSWYEEYYSWLKGKYHQGYHHQLFLDFVDRLIIGNN